MTKSNLISINNFNIMEKKISKKGAGKSKKVNSEMPMSIIKNDIDKLFFADVKKKPAIELMPGFVFNSYNDTIVQVETEQGAVICNNCSENYLLIPNKEIFPILEKEMQKFGLSSVHRKVLDHSVFFADYDFIDDSKKIEVAKGDIIFPRISIENSYNSKYLFKISAAFMRQVCTNGLCLPVEDSSFNAILSHSKGNVNKIIEESIAGINNFFSNAKEIAGEYEVLMEKHIQISDVEDCVQAILKKSNSLLSCKEQIVERIKAENKMGIELNMFNIYNGINYFLQPEHNDWITPDAVRRRQMDEKILDICFNMAE